MDECTLSACLLEEGPNKDVYTTDTHTYTLSLLGLLSDTLFSLVFWQKQALREGGGREGADKIKTEKTEVERKYFMRGVGIEKRRVKKGMGQERGERWRDVDRERGMEERIVKRRIRREREE